MLTLSLKKLNRITLSKHYLLSKSKNIVEVISRICGLNAQVASAPYLSLWNRVSGFKKITLERELYGKRGVVKSWFMRGTVHIIAADEYPIYRSALKASMVRDWNHHLERRGGPYSREVARLSEGILRALENSPLTKREIGERVSQLLMGYGEKEGKILLSRTIRGLSYQGFLCHTQPTGPWYHFKENRFARTDRWLPDLKSEKIDESQAKRELLLRYLRGYGPATLQDFAHWAGYRVSEAKESWELAQDRLIEIKVAEVKGQYWMLKDDLEQLEKRLFDEPPLHILPGFDPLLMGHREKSRFLDQAHKKKVFLPLADVAPTILLAGRLAGTWSYRKGRDHLIMKVSPFIDLGDKELKETKNQAEALSVFIGFGPLHLELK